MCTLHRLSLFRSRQRQQQVLPARLPQLLLNGTVGIAVGLYAILSVAFGADVLANPALFRLIFVYACPDGPTVFGNSLAARMLQDYAAALAPDPAEAQRMIVQAWALVHGLAMLMLDGQLPADDSLIDRIIDTRTLFAR